VDDLEKAKADLLAHNYGKAIFTLENTLHYKAGNVDDSLRCLARLKNAFVEIKNINKAFEMQYLIERCWSRKSDTAKIEYGIKESELFIQLGLKGEAIKQRRKEFNELDNKNDTDVVLNFYNDMGVFYNLKKIPDSAGVYFVRALQLLSQKKSPATRKSHYDFYKGLISGNLGKSYHLKGENEKALPLLQKDAYHSLKYGQFESAFNSYNLLVECCLLVNKSGLAKAFLDSSEYLLTEKLKRPGLRLKFLMVQAKYYHALQKFDLASKSYLHYYSLSDSIHDIEKEEELIKQGVAFNIEKRELEFAERENSLRQLKEKEEKEKMYRSYLLSGLLVLFAAIIFLIINIRTFKKREKQLSSKNEQIQVQHSQIEQSLKEKEALIREIHHRVKNNLQIINSMLNLQIGKIQDEKTESIFFEAKQRINAIALTHQMLYQKTTVSNINLGEYVETLVRQIEAAMSSTTVQMHTEIAHTMERLTIDGAVPLGLIINELLTNAYKHAFPRGKKGDITVSLIENAETFTIKVRDNGVGLPEGFNHFESQTLGMELIFILVEQLESKLTIKSENGSMFMFDIKKHN
jgi:two-component sensor histidine kinase